METTQTANPLNFETVWAALMEDRERLKETERILKENSERYERARKESEADFNRKLGEYINLFGEVSEYTIAPKLREKFIEFGLTFPKAERNVSVRDKINNLFFEIDVMLENGDKAVLVEIKTKLTIERINSHIERLEKMRRYADLRGDSGLKSGRTFLGAVAGVVVTDEVRNYALDQGFYLIEPEGQNLNITPPNGEPKEW
jgi:ribosomal protein L9